MNTGPISFEIWPRLDLASGQHDLAVSNQAASPIMNTGPISFQEWPRLDLASGQNDLAIDNQVASPIIGTGFNTWPPPDPSDLSNYYLHLWED